MSAAVLSIQLSQISDSLRATNALINRLATLTFQPGSEPLKGDGGVRSEFTQDIHDSLKQLDEDFELLKQDTDDFNNTHSAHHGKRLDTERDRERLRVEANVARLSEDLRRARSSFRKAQLKAKRASDAAKQQERELVYANLQKPLPSTSDEAEVSAASKADLFAGRRLLAQKSKLSREELEVDASTNITTALRRTHDLLSTELSRSRFAQETFDQSTAALAELGEHYGNLDTVLTNSRALLSTLLRSQKSDTWYLETAFYILIATLTWLVFRRLLLGPFVRLPLFFLRIVVFVLNWVIWKPIYLLLTLTGVIITDPKKTGFAPAKSRRPLIVQPSASGHFVKMPDGKIRPAAVPAGAGGAHAKKGLVGEMSEEIGRMAEANANAAQNSGEQIAQEREPVRRGDGTILEERDPAVDPPNPKKKDFDVTAEDGKEEKRKRDEL